MGDEPIISTPPEGGKKEQAHVMGTRLVQAIEEGKHEVPETIAPLVCKPQKLESWRVFKIMAEFVDGFDILRKYGLAASFFGSVRTTPEDRHYQEASKLAGLLSKQGFAVITGGSAGIMEAANEGAYQAGGASIGLNIRLTDKQSLNGFLTESFVFDHFFVRKVMLAFASEVYIYFPGGYGTLDEFTELLTLVQTKKIRKVPIVLYGKEYWTPIVDLFTNHLLGKYQTINAEDLELFVVVDSVEEAFAYITKNVVC